MHLRHFAAFMTAFVIVVALAPHPAEAQTETKGRRVEVDSATGKRKVVEYEDVSKSEVITPIRNLVTVDPFKFFVLVNSCYYHMIAPGIALGGGLAAGIWGQAPVPVEFTAEARFYTSARNSLRGFHISPVIQYAVNYGGIFNLFGFNSQSHFNLLTVGVLAEWQWFSDDGFAYAFGLGIDKRFLYGDSTVTNNDFNIPMPSMRFTIGYGWE